MEYWHTLLFTIIVVILALFIAYYAGLSACEVHTPQAQQQPVPQNTSATVMGTGTAVLMMAIPWMS